MDTGCWLILIYADQCWFVLIDADWCWLMLIDADWCWLMLFDVDWCWLMLKKRFNQVSFCRSIYPKSLRSFLYALGSSHNSYIFKLLKALLPKDIIAFFLELHLHLPFMFVCFLPHLCELLSVASMHICIVVTI